MMNDPALSEYALCICGEYVTTVEVQGGVFLGYVQARCFSCGKHTRFMGLKENTMKEWDSMIRQPAGGSVSSEIRNDDYDEVPQETGDYRSDEA